MQSISGTNFGLLIAYVLPGFAMLLGLSPVSETVRLWVGSPNELPTVAGMLYGTLATLGCGLTASTIRWGIIDTIHHRTGIREAQWDFAQLRGNVTAYELLIQNHYKYYKCYGNSLVSLCVAFVCRLVVDGWRGLIYLPPALLLGGMLWIASRDTLSKYYRRGDMLFAVPGSKKHRPRTHSQRRRK